MFSFKILKEDSKSQARAGVITTSRGKIRTPVFMPVGTQATVKTLSPKELKEMGTEIILANAYHLYLRPGIKIIEEFGGVGKFMSWSGPILTDSGGYQVFSLARLRRVMDRGVEFRSHIDGSLHFLTPFEAVKIQKILGGDVIMAFDECLLYPAPRSYTQEAMERTHLWALECQKAFENPKLNPKSSNINSQVLFGITQGGMYEELRRESAAVLRDLDFPGYGIGGLSVGEPRNLTWQMLEVQNEILPFSKPRYLMGIGEPRDLLEAVERGCDMFDSAMPTRLARNGTVFTDWGRLNLRLRRYKRDKNPICEECFCYTCRTFSRAYLRHLIIAGEVLGIRLTTYHNLYFILNLMQRIRKAIREDRFVEFKNKFLSKFNNN